MVVLPLPAGPESTIAPDVSPSSRPRPSLTSAGSPSSSSRRNSPGAREQTNDGLLAEERGKRAHPHLDFARRPLDPPFLRHVGPVGEQLRKNLEPRHDIGGDLRRNRSPPAATRRRSARTARARRRRAENARRSRRSLAAPESTRSTTSVAYRGSAGSYFFRASERSSACMLDQVSGTGSFTIGAPRSSDTSDCTAGWSGGSSTRFGCGVHADRRTRSAIIGSQALRSRPKWPSRPFDERMGDGVMSTITSVRRNLAARADMAPAASAVPTRRPANCDPRLVVGSLRRAFRCHRRSAESLSGV